MAETDWAGIAKLIHQYEKQLELDRKRREKLFGPEGLWPLPPPQPGQQIYKCNWRTNLYTGYSWIESMVQRDGTVIQLPPWPRPLPGDQQNWCLHCNSWHPTWWMTDMIQGDWQRLPKVPTRISLSRLSQTPPSDLTTFRIGPRLGTSSLWDSCSDTRG